MSDGAYGPVYAKVAPRRPLQSGAIYDNVVPIAGRGAATGKTLQALTIGNPAFASTNKLLDENLIFCTENTGDCRQSKANKRVMYSIETFGAG